MLGMDSSSISVPLPDVDQSWRVDVPMRSFQGGMHLDIDLVFYSQWIHSYTSRILPTTHRIVQTARCRIPKSRLLVLFLAPLTAFYDPSKADNRNDDIQWKLWAWGAEYAFAPGRTVPLHEGPRFPGACVHEGVDGGAFHLFDDVHHDVLLAHAFPFDAYIEIK